jgi:hypothetical protein
MNGLNTKICRSVSLHVNTCLHHPIHVHLLLTRLSKITWLWYSVIFDLWRASYVCIPLRCPQSYIYHTPSGCCSVTPTHLWRSSSRTLTFLSTASSWSLSQNMATSSPWQKCTELAPRFLCRHTASVAGLLLAASRGLHRASTAGGTIFKESSSMWR